MAAKSLKLTIVTQEKLLLEREAESMTVKTTSGEITVLPNHVPLFTRLADGELVCRWHEGDHLKTESYAVSGGFLDVGPDSSITVLADHAIRADEISEAKAEEARQLAEEAMKNRQSEVEFRLAEASLRRALAELEVVKKRKTGKMGPGL
jgi:F-type H+-transporting ATPase subunit epsilon